MYQLDRELPRRMSGTCSKVSRCSPWSIAARNFRTLLGGSGCFPRISRGNRLACRGPDRPSCFDVERIASQRPALSSRCSRSVTACFPPAGPAAAACQVWKARRDQPLMPREATTRPSTRRLLNGHSHGRNPQSLLRPSHRNTNDSFARRVLTSPPCV